MNNNNITNLTTYDKQNNMTNFYTQGIPNDITNTQLYQDTEHVREEALTNTLAGIPPVYIAPSTTQTHPNVDNDDPVTSQATTRQQVMAAAGLTNPDGTYKSTYQDYISQGNPIPKGYEWAHQEVLALEGRENIFKKYADGEISYDSALMEAYGRDILNNAGYDLHNVGYWMNKYLSHDYTSPFNDPILMKQVRTQAEEMYKQDQITKFGNTNTSNTNLAALVGDDLSASKIKEVFGDIGKWAEEQQISDSSLLRMVRSGTIEASARLRQVDETTYYYLHTDGRLHKLTKGEGIKFDKDGNITEISLNGNDFFDVGDQFIASVGEVFTAIPKIGALVTSIPFALINGNDYGTEVAEEIQNIDAFINHDISFLGLLRRDYVDMNGFNGIPGMGGEWELKDTVVGVANIAGMVVGSKGLSAIGSGTMSAGDKLMKAGHPIAGQALKTTGSLAMRSTGWYPGMDPNTVTLLGGKTIEGVGAKWLNQFVICAPNAMKDFYNTANQLYTINIQAQMSGQDAVFDDVWERAARTALINYGLSVVFSSTIGSRLDERLSDNTALGSHDLTKFTPHNVEVMNNAITNATLKDMMRHDLRAIKWSSFFDMANTIMGNQIQNAATATKRENGKLTAADWTEYLFGYTNTDAEGRETQVGPLWKRADFWKDVIQTGVMQWTEYTNAKKSILSGYHTVYENIIQTNNLFLDKFRTTIDNTKDAQQKENLELIRRDFINDLNSVDNGASVEERIAKAWSNLSDKLGKVPKDLADAINETDVSIKAEYFTAAARYIETADKLYNEYAGETFLAASTQRNFIKRRISNMLINATNKFHGLSGDMLATEIVRDENGQVVLDTNGQPRTRLVSKFHSATESLMNDTYKEYLKATRTDDETIERYLGDAIELKYDDALEVTPGDTLTQQELSLIKDANGAEHKVTSPTSLIVYKIKQEAGYSENIIDNSRLKGQAFKSTAEVLMQKGLPIYKIDENTYVLDAPSAIAATFTFETQANLNAAIMKLKSNSVVDIQKGIAAISTILSDKGDLTATKYQDIKDVFSTAVANGVLTDIEAADAMRLARDTESDDANLNNVAKIIKSGTDAFPKNYNELTDPLDKMIMTIDAVDNLKKATNKKLLTDSDKRNYNFLFNKEVGIRPDAQSYVDRLIQTKRISYDDIHTLNDIIKSQGDADFFPKGRDIFDAILTKVSQTEQAEDVLGNKEQIGRIISEKDKKTMSALIQKDLDILADYNAHIEEAELNGKYVKVDLTQYAGERTYEAMKQIEQIQRSREEVGFGTDLPQYMSGIQYEAETRFGVIQEQGKTYVIFNIEDPIQLEGFNDLCVDKLHAIPNRIEDPKVLESVIENDLKNGWDNAITINSGTQKFLKVTAGDKLSKAQFDLSGIEADQISVGSNGDINSYDVLLDIASKQYISKLSNKTKKRRTFKELILNPFGKAREQKSLQGTQLETDIATGKQGTAGKYSKGTYEYVNPQYLDVYDIDPEIAKYAVIRNIIENSDDYSFTFHIPEAEQQAFKNRLYKLHIIGSEGFYELDTVTKGNTGFFTIKIKEDAKPKMINYLNSAGADFNMFRIIPLISNEHLGPNNYLTLDKADGMLTYKGEDGQVHQVSIPDMNNGNQSYGGSLHKIYNLHNGFDKGVVYLNQILGTMAEDNWNKTYEYNPFGNTKLSSDYSDAEVSKAYYEGDMETLSQYAETNYLARYLRNVVEIENTFVTDDTSEDYKLLLSDANVLRLLKNKADQGTVEYNAELFNEIKKIYNEGLSKRAATYATSYEDTPINYTSPIVSYGIDYDDNATYMSAKILSNITGTEYYIDFNSPDTEYLETVVKQAVDAVNTYGIEGLRPKITTGGSDFVLYKNNNVTRVLQGLVGNDNRINIEDADAWAHLSDNDIARLASLSRGTLSESDIRKYQLSAQSFISSRDALSKELSVRTYSVKENPQGSETPSIELTGKSGVTTLKTGKPDSITEDLIKDNTQKINKDAYRKLSDNYIDSINSDLDDLEREAFNNSQEAMQKALRDETLTTHDGEVNNMENIFSRERRYKVLNETYNNLNEISTDETRKINMTRDMVTTATDPNKGAWEQYKVYNKDGVDILNVPRDYENDFEFYLTFDDIEKKLDTDKDLVFVRLEKHNKKSSEGIKFSYVTLNKENIKEIEGGFLSKAFENNRRREAPEASFQEYTDHLFRLQENNPYEYNNRIEDMARFGLSAKGRRNQDIDNVVEHFKGKYSTEQIKNLLIPYRSVDYHNAGITNYFNELSTSLNSNNEWERSQAALATYGIDLSVLSDADVAQLRTEAQEVERISNLTMVEKDFAKNLSKLRYGTVEFNEALYKGIEDGTVNQDNAGRILNVYIANNMSPEALAYKTSGVFFEDMINLRVPSPTVKYANSDDGIRIADFKDTDCVLLDCETPIPTKGLDSSVQLYGDIKDIFQISFKFFNAESNEWEKQTYFIDHGISTEQWAEQHNLIHNAYYDTKQGYKNAVDYYVKGEGDNFISEKRLSEIIAGFGDATFVASNGKNFDFRYLQGRSENSKLLDAMDFVNILELGDTNDKLNQEVKGAKSDNPRIKALIDGAHDSEVDIDVMHELINDTAYGYQEPCLKAKMRFKTEIDDIASRLGVTPDYHEMDNIFKGAYLQYGYADRFVQGMQDGSDMAFLVRVLNRLETNDIGYVLRNFINSPDFIKDVGLGGLEDFVKTGGQYHVIDLVTQEALENNVSASQAFDNVIYKSADMLKNESTEYKDIPRNNLLLNTKNMEVTMDRNSEDFIKKRNEILHAIKSHSNDGIISKEDYRTVKESGRGQQFLITGEKLIESDNKLVQSDTMKKLLDHKHFTYLSSTETGLEQFGQKQVFHTKTKGTENYIEQARDLSDLKGYIAYYQNGAYKKIIPASVSQEYNLLHWDGQKLVADETPSKIESSASVMMDKKAFLNMTRYQPAAVFDANGEAYVCVLRQPSDGPLSRDYMKLRIIDGDEGNIYISPALWRSKYSGDFDGDAITIFTVDSDWEKAIASFTANNLYSGYNVQEDLWNNMFLKNSMYGNAENSKLSEALSISNAKEVIKASKAIDKMLKNNKYSEDSARQLLNEAFNKVKLQDPTLSIDNDTLWDYIGVKESNGHRYIRNYNVLNDQTSYSALQALEAVDDTMSVKSNLGDSLYGFHKQRFTSSLKTIQDLQDNPLMKLNIATTRLASEFQAGILSTEWNASSVNDYFDVLASSLKKHVKDFDIDQTDYINKIANRLKSKTFRSEILKGKDNDLIANRVLTETSLIVNALDNATRLDTIKNGELGSILSNADISTNFEDTMNRNKEIHNLVKKLAPKPLVTGGSSQQDDRITSMLIGDMASQFEYSQRTQFTSNIDEQLKNNRVNVAILDGLPIEGAPDVVYVNKNSKAKHIKSSLEIDPEDFADSDGIIQDKFLQKLLNKKVITKDDVADLLKQSGMEEIEVLKGTKKEKILLAKDIANENNELYKKLKEGNPNVAQQLEAYSQQYEELQEYKQQVYDLIQNIRGKKQNIPYREQDKLLKTFLGDLYDDLKDLDKRYMIEQLHTVLQDKKVEMNDLVGLQHSFIDALKADKQITADLIKQNKAIKEEYYAQADVIDSNIKKAYAGLKDKNPYYRERKRLYNYLSSIDSADFFVPTQTNEGTIKILSIEDLANCKLYALGKGMSQNFEVVSVDLPQDIDILISADAISRMDKLGIKRTFNNIVGNQVNLDFNVGTNAYKDRTARLFSNVPLYVLETFNTDVNPYKSQKVDLMTNQSNIASLSDIGMKGSYAISRDDEGRVSYTNEPIIEAIQEANNSKSIAFANQAETTLLYRDLILGKIINKYNLWSEYNEKNPDYEPINDELSYQEFTVNNYNPASLGLYLKIQNTLNFLEHSSAKISLEDILKDPDIPDNIKQVFSTEMENELTAYVPGTIKDYGNGIRLTSKTKAPQDMAKYCSVITGRNINPGEVNVRRNPGIMTEEFFYVPTDRWMRIMCGYTPNTLDVMDATAKELLSYDQHYAGEQGMNFRPMSKLWAVQTTDSAMEPWGDNVKNGFTQLASDSRMILPSDGPVRNKREIPMEYPEFDYIGKYQRALAKNEYGEYKVPKLNTIKQQITDLIAAPDRTTGIIQAGNRNYSTELAIDGIQQRWKLRDEGPLKTISDNSKRGTYSNLTGKGADFLTHNYSFLTFNDVLDKYVENNKNKISKTDLKLLKDPVENTVQDTAVYDELCNILNDNSKRSAGFTKEVSDNYADPKGLNVQLIKARDDIDYFEPSLISGMGAKIKPGQKGDVISVQQSWEYSQGQAAFIEAQENEKLSNLQKSIKRSGISNTEFDGYLLYRHFKELKEQGDATYDTRLAAKQITQEDLDTIYLAYYNKVNSNPEVVSHIENVLKGKQEIDKRLNEIYKEPFGNTMQYLVPGISRKDKEIRYGEVKKAIGNMLGFDYIDKHGNPKENVGLDFFDAHKIMNRQAAQLIGLNNMFETYKARQLMENTSTMNALDKFLAEDFDVNKLYVNRDDLLKPEWMHIHNTIMDVIQYYTDLDVTAVTKEGKNSVEKTKILYKALNQETENYKQQLEQLQGVLTNSGTHIVNGTTFSDIQYALASNPSREVRDLLRKTYNAMTARMLVAQHIFDQDPRVMDNFTKFIQNTLTNGKSFVNEYAQRLSRDSYVAPIGDTSLKHLTQNLELALNNQSEAKFNQYLAEKALRGELYIMPTNLATFLEETVYTRKNPTRVGKLLRTISSASAGIQMAMPAKLLPRFARWTGTDYMFAATYSPKAVKNIPEAAKEISAAIYSKGASMKDGDRFDDNNLLYKYLQWEGQPLNVTNKDPITFQEDIPSTVGQVTDKMTKLLAYQNHYGRYAIWKTAYESFENNDPIYGPCYHLKDQIDKLPSSEAKATFVMDYMIGSPNGGFPALSKKTNGYMMFATFPMNLTRTAGAYGMSLGTLFKEGFTSENAPHWMRTVGSPSIAAVACAYLSSMLISNLCEKYGVDEETEKKWKEEGVFVDPLGTILGGTPSVTYDSINPVYQLKEMYVNPWINEYNKTFGDKALGFLSQNFLGKLNPALKTPMEIALQKDFIGNSVRDTSDYSRWENGTRKALGLLLGSSIANSIVDMNQDNPFPANLYKGFINGLSGDLGNQKSWKKNISNYYSAIHSIQAYNGATGYTGATYEDLTDAEYLKGQRNSKGKYGYVDDEDYQRVNKKLKKMIQNSETPSVIYAYIAEEYNKGTSEATLRKALNNNSIIRKLNGVNNKEDFYKTLSEKELLALEKAIIWEKETYPILQEFFPNNYSYSTSIKKAYAKKPYDWVGNYYPKSYSPKKSPQVNYYPNNGYSNKKLSTKNPKASINKVNVEVSPQMAVWNQDYNKVTDLQNWNNQTYKRTKPLNHGGGK